MNAENRRRNAEVELEKASEALREAETLVREGLLRGAIARGYFGLFHAARALLFTRGHEARTHQGVETLLGLHFIRTKDLEAEWAGVFARLRSYREQADYGPVLGLSAEGVRRELDAVARFLAIVRERLG